MEGSLAPQNGELNYKKGPKRSRLLIAIIITLSTVIIAVILLNLIKTFSAPKSVTYDCGCQNTLFTASEKALTLYEKTGSFGSNETSALKQLNSLNLVYSFTAHASSSVDEVSVLVGPYNQAKTADNQKNTWEILEVRGFNNLCFAIALVKSNSSYPWKLSSAGIYYGVYKPDSLDECQATTKGPLSLSDKSFQTPS